MNNIISNFHSAPFKVQQYFRNSDMGCSVLQLLTTFQFLHESIHDEVVGKLAKAYAQVRIGDPWDRK